jgi:hypothetical protein
MKIVEWKQPRTSCQNCDGIKISLDLQTKYDDNAATHGFYVRNLLGRIINNNNNNNREAIPFTQHLSAQFMR